MDADWIAESNKRLELMPAEVREIRERAMSDLFFFAQLVNPGYMYGEIHREIFLWVISSVPTSL